MPSPAVPQEAGLAAWANCRYKAKLGAEQSRDDALFLPIVQLPAQPAVAKPIPFLSPAEIARILDTAWHSSDPLTAVLYQHGLSEGPLVQLLRRELSPAAYKFWTQRLKATGRKAPLRDGWMGAAPKGPATGLKTARGKGPRAGRGAKPTVSRSKPTK